MEKINKAKWLEVLVYILLSFMVSYVAINGLTPFRIPADGQIHLARYEQVFQSLHHASIPSEISFIGPGHNLNAVVSCYPWLGGLIFIIPRFIFFKHIMLAILGGFWLISLLTALAMYYLVRTLGCNSSVLRVCLVSYWLFNSYHLNLLYFRMAFGEFLAYAYLPLVVAGLLKIYRKERSGIIPLVIGMSGIANSHLLSLLIVTIGISICELFRIILKKISKFEFVALLISAVCSLFLSAYSLWGVFYIQANNSVIAPFKNLINLSIKDSLRTQLSGIITQNPSMWGIGLIGLVLLLVFLLLSIKIKLIRPYMLLCALILIITYVPFSNHSELIQSFGVIQFTGRLLTYVVLFQVIAMALYFKQADGLFIRLISVVTMCLLVCLGSVSVVKHEMGKVQEDDSLASYVYSINSSNYQKEIQAPNYNNFNDYLPGNGVIGTGKVYPYNDSWISLTQIHGTYNQAVFRIISSKASMSSLALAKYKGISYSVELNEKPISIANTNGYFKLALPRGVSYLKVSSNPTMITKILFILSCLSYGVFGACLIKYMKKRMV